MTQTLALLQVPPAIAHDASQGGLPPLPPVPVELVVMPPPLLLLVISAADELSFPPIPAAALAPPVLKSLPLFAAEQAAATMAPANNRDQAKRCVMAQPSGCNIAVTPAGGSCKPHWISFF